MLQIELPGLGWLHSHIPEAHCDLDSKPVPHMADVHDSHAVPDAVGQHVSKDTFVLHADIDGDSQHDVKAESHCVAGGKQIATMLEQKSNKVTAES